MWKIAAVSLSLVCAVFLAKPASATCLSVDVDYGISGAWVNDCGVGVTVKWETETGHRGLTWVGSYDIDSAYLRGQGRIRWSECESPHPYQHTPSHVGSGYCE